MKKTFFTILFSVVLFSCDKNAIQQTTDSLKKADSLFTKTNDGLKTLDSISKTIADSEGIAKNILIPEIEKQKNAIGSTLSSGNFKIDSINKELEKITKTVTNGTTVVQSLDSANQAIKNGENPISVLTETANKIFNQSKEVQNTRSDKSQNFLKDRENSGILMEKDPIVKSGILEIEVEDISAAKSALKEFLNHNNAELVTEKFNQAEGFEREYVTVKVPLKNFDGLMADFSNRLGEVRLKNTNAEGTDYVSRQMCDVEITLVQKEKFASSPLTNIDSEKNPDSFGAKSSGAFMSGFKVLETIVIAVLPFWPLFLIGALVWYFLRRKKRKELENAQEDSVEKNTVQEITEIETAVPEEKKTEVPTDYSKYLPKE